MPIFPLIGPSFKSEEQDNNYQECLNMYIINGGQDARSKIALKKAAGLLEVVDLNGGRCRGITTLAAATYVVMDNEVYRIAINSLTGVAGTPLLCGTMVSSTGYVRFAKNPTQIIIVDGTERGYIIDIATGVMTQIADNDFVGGIHVVFCDGYFMYNEANTAFLRVSSINDGETYDAADVATAESKPDKLLGLAVNKGEVWAFGAETVEVWYNAANAVGMPFSPRVGSELDIGCAASGSIVEINNIIMWLDNRGLVVQSQISAYTRNQSSGYDLKVVSDSALQAEIASYSVINDAIATAYVERGHIIYQITFPSAGKTWCYDQSSGAWFERSFYNATTGNMEAHLIQFAAPLGTTTVACGINSSKVYLMNANYFDDAGDTIVCRHTTAPLSSEGKILGINSVKIRFGSGRATSTGLGSNPQVSLRYSNDGGHTWSHHMARDLGDIGVYGRQVTWNRLGSAREWMFEISVAEPIDFSIIEGVVDADLEG